jgi:hypothetical protein
MKIEDYFIDEDLSDLKDKYHKRFVYDLLTGNFYVRVEEDRDYINYFLTIKTRYSTEEFSYYINKNNDYISTYHKKGSLKSENKELLKTIHNKTLEVIKNNKIENVKYEIETQLKLAERDLNDRINKVNRLKEELNKLIK